MEKKIIELEECPICRGDGLIMHEGGWSVQVECVDCSAHTIYMEYNNDAEAERTLMDEAIADAEVMAISGEIPSGFMNNTPVQGQSDDLPF